MRKINFSKEILPHIVAVLTFLLVTVFFFSPVFFEHKSISQHDIDQGGGLSKDLTDYREKTGEEGLWAASAFSGMPAYLVGVKSSNGAVYFLENIYSLYLPHPVKKIFAAFLSFYILLLAFRVRPYLAIAGALAFGLSSYVIIGLSAGHNARIAAIAYMPLVLAGVHLAFSGRRILGAGVTLLGLALELKANHVQITYYLMFIIAGYGIMQLVIAIREKKLSGYITTVAILVACAILSVGSYLMPLWSISEYTPYSIRGASELRVPGAPPAKDGLTRSYAFSYKYGFWEPITLLIPKFYGGDNSVDENSHAYKALVDVAQTGDSKTANALVQNTASYWGPGTGGAYYGGAIIVFLFVLGILLADKKYVWWLVPLSLLSLALSVGDSFSTFNYWMFDHFPMYNKFRSFSFGLIIILFCMPLLGFIGLEKLFVAGISKETKRKLLIAFAATGGFCLLLAVFAGLGDYLRDGEAALPVWFKTALIEDREGLLRSDAFRSFVFIALVFIALYFDLPKKISVSGFFVFLIALMLIDLVVVDRRSFSKANFHRKTEETFTPNAADEEILKDKTYYRVFDISRGPYDVMANARPSYFHHSLGGYHGAKMHRYQELFDSAIVLDVQKIDRDFRRQQINFDDYTTLNMLNTKYIVISEEARGVIPNPAAYGNAWFVKKVENVASPTEELKKITEVNPKETAVIDASKFKVASPAAYDSTAHISLSEMKLPYLKYESASPVSGLAVFSEIYYPKGWTAFIDGKESPILRADYVLRALEIPAGKHVIEFKFSPTPYVVGDKITMVSSWLVLLLVLASIGMAAKEELGTVSK